MKMDDFGIGGPLPESRDDLRALRREAVERQIRETEEEIQYDKAVEAAKRGDGTSWVSLFANMLISGSPIEQCAVRLGRPKAFLVRLLNEEFFKTMLDQIAAEGKANVGLALLKGSTVDNIYTLIQIRNAPSSKPELRAKVAMYLLDRTEGVRKEGFGGQLGHGLLDQIGAGGVDQSITKEIEQHLAAHPEIGAIARRVVSAGVSALDAPDAPDAPAGIITPMSVANADAPESVQECVEEGQVLDASGLASATMG